MILLTSRPMSRWLLLRMASYLGTLVRESCNVHLYCCLICFLQPDHVFLFLLTFDSFFPVYDVSGAASDRNCVVLSDIHIDIMDYIQPASCTDAEFRQMWAEFEWENKVNFAFQLCSHFPETDFKKYC